MVGKKKIRKILFITAALAILTTSASVKGKTIEMFDQNTQLIHVGVGINGTAIPIELSTKKGLKMIYLVLKDLI